MEAYSQEIEVGPVRVDTGNDGLDLLFAIILIVLLLYFCSKMKRC